MSAQVTDEVMQLLVDRFSEQLLTDKQAAALLQVSLAAFIRREFKAELLAAGAKVFPLPVRGKGERINYRWSRLSLLALPRRIGARAAGSVNRGA